MFFHAQGGDLGETDRLHAPHSAGQRFFATPALVQDGHARFDLHRVRGEDIGLDFQRAGIADFQQGLAAADHAFAFLMQFENPAGDGRGHPHDILWIRRRVSGVTQRRARRLEFVFGDVHGEQGGAQPGLSAALDCSGLVEPFCRDVTRFHERLESRQFRDGQVGFGTCDTDVLFGGVQRGFRGGDPGAGLGPAAWIESLRL